MVSGDRAADSSERTGAVPICGPASVRAPYPQGAIRSPAVPGDGPGSCGAWMPVRGETTESGYVQVAQRAACATGSARGRQPGQPVADDGARLAHDPLHHVGGRLDGGDEAGVLAEQDRDAVVRARLPRGGDLGGDRRAALA